MEHEYKEFDIKKYNQLKTLAAKAAYLLTCRITTREAIKCTTPCFQAKVGTVDLPVYGDDEKQTVEKAVFWLKESSLNYKALSEAGI